MITHTTNWLLAALLAITLAAANNLDGPTDHQGEWDQSTALQEPQTSQAGTARRGLVNTGTKAVQL